MAAAEAPPANRTYVPSDPERNLGRRVQTTVQRLTKSARPRAVELFAGAGGLALGLRRAGFSTELAVEWDDRAVDTLRANKRKYTRGWSLKSEDVRQLDYAALDLADIDIVSAGAPCQPFSIGGRLRGEDDPRNMFPEVVRAVRELRPRSFLFENVRGLLFPRALPYFEYILAQLRNPSRVRRADEDWKAHKAALDRIPADEHEYVVDWKILNAADFGVPQNRPRLVVVGVRADIQRTFLWPDATHSKVALVNALLGDDYWEAFGVAEGVRAAARVGLRQCLDDDLEPWMTLRDVLTRLGPPLGEGAKDGDLAHRFVPGARLYTKHAGSRLDWPAKTIKAGVHGCPGGEHIALLDDGSHRYLTVRECAAIQGFPDDYALDHIRTRAMKQLGNAVPVPLAEAVGSRLVEVLDG